MLDMSKGRWKFGTGLVLGISLLGALGAVNGVFNNLTVGGTANLNGSLNAANANLGSNVTSASANINGNQVLTGELDMGQAFNFFPMIMGYGSTSAPPSNLIRRAFTCDADPGGGCRLWLSSTQNNAGFYVQATNGAGWGSIQPDGYHGNVQAGTINGSTANISGLLTATNVSTNGLGITGSGSLTGNWGIGGNEIVTGTSTASGGYNGSLNGNAATATQLRTAPSNCSNSYSQGIQANGTANCSLQGYTIAARVGGCTTAGGSFQTCSVTVTFGGFSDGSSNYAAVCTGESASDPRAAINDISFRASTNFRVDVVNEGSASGVGYQFINCTITHP